MTSPRIEEIMKEFDTLPFRVMTPINQEMMWGEVVGLEADGMLQLKDWLRQALTEAYQAGIDEAVEKINKKYWLNPKRSKKDTAKDNAWNDLGNTLRNGV